MRPRGLERGVVQGFTALDRIIRRWAGKSVRTCGSRWNRGRDWRRQVCQWGITGAFSYLFNALGHKIIKELYDLRSGQYAGELRGHHKFDEALARKYDDYMSPDAVNAAATDRIGQGYTNTGLPGDPHAWNDAHKAATRALDTQMDDWIASGRISKGQPMTQRQYYEFMNEASRVPAVSKFWKSIQEFVDLMQSRRIQPKLRGMPRARGISE